MMGKMGSLLSVAVRFRVRRTGGSGGVMVILFHGKNLLFEAAGRSKGKLL
jgi:hypothetical protein